MPTERAKRTSETRETEERVKSWAPPEILPEPEPQDGFVFRWIRTSTLGKADNRNVSVRMREGWEPVKAEDHKDLKIQSDYNSSFAGNIEVGGLLLCKTAKENMDRRSKHYTDKARDQMEGVEKSYLRDNDPRMQRFMEKDTRVTFGKGGPSE